MIGIGITTYLRPKQLEFILQQIDKFKGDHELLVYVWDDSETKRGVAYGKNMCLSNLRNCDHIFLLDDDIFPIAEGWIDHFVNSGYHHSCYMNDNYRRSFTATKENSFTIIDGVLMDKHCSYMDSSGVLMYLTKKCFEVVGYLNPEYLRYGYEHSGYSHRIFEAGLTPSRFIALQGINKFLHSLDLDGIKGYEFLEHKRMITMEEINECRLASDRIYCKETTSTQIKYEFKP